LSLFSGCPVYIAPPLASVSLMACHANGQSIASPTSTFR
jgi:hypothetical protein